MDTSPAVRARSLSKRYGAVTALHEVDLEIERGIIATVLGRNGAGKTTLIECAEGLRKPDSGIVRILGLDPLADAQTIRAKVGVMLQDGGLPPGATPKELIQHIAGFFRHPRDPIELEAELGIDAFDSRPIRRLSGGQRQRVAFATAIIGRPELVFLDEPSAGLDPHARHAMWDTIRQLRDDGTSIIMTTHQLDEAQNLSDRIIILNHGTVIANGTIDEIITAAAPTTQIQLRTAEPISDAETQAAITHGIRILLAPDGYTVTTLDENTDPVAATMRWATTANVHVISLTTTATTVEDAYLALTSATQQEGRW